MRQKWLKLKRINGGLQRYWKLSVVSCLVLGEAIASSGNYAWGQIASDNTLGSESSFVTSPIPGAFLIEGGATRGTNLFHSFSEFSVPTLGIAYFNNAAEIQNILSRVTGASISNIDGLIAANGTANLFLLNPNGIIFGSNAALNIGGSFVGSTASSLNFADGTQFSATGSQTTPLLTVSVPVGLQYGGNAGSIQVQNSTLQVPNGETLALVGGNVQINGAFLQAEGGRVELGGVAESGTVALNLDDNNLRLSFPDGVALADVSLSNGAAVVANGEGGGNIQVQGNRITLTDESAITADTQGSENGGGIFLQASQLIVRDGSFVSAGTEGTGQGGTLTVNASDTVEVSGTAPDGYPSFLGVNALSAGAAGNLDITTRHLIVRDALVQAGTADTGQGGTLSVNASDSVKVSGTILSGQSSAGLFTQTEGSGDAGNLTIATGQLIVQDGAQISASTQGNGGGGNLTINAPDSLAVMGTAANGEFPSGLFTNTRGTKPAGNLTIVTGQLIVRDGGQVSTSTSNQGQGGTLAVKASESVELSGSSADGQLFSSLLTQTQGAGAAGDLRIVTGQLIIRDGALVSSSSRIEGAAGNLTVNASGSVEIIGTTPNGQRNSGLFTQTQGLGDAGDLTIEARQLIVRDGGLVSARTLGEGLGGRLTVNASESVELIGTSADGRYRSSLSASTEGGGDAGNLRIDTARLILRDGAQAATGTFGKGKGGILTINAPESVELIGFGSGLFTQTEGSGDAGNLRIDTGQLAIQAGARISTASFAEGRGGDLQVNAAKFVELIGTSADRQSSSGLSTQAVGTGDAGDLRIDTGRLILRDGAVVSAGTLSQGQGGTLAVTASESVELIGSGSGLSTETKGSGDAGNLRIDTGNVIVRDEALVSARTFGMGQGGNLSIATEELNVEDGGAISVNSVGTGRAGNLEVTSGSVSLDEGFISATTLSGDGGNISLQVKDLLLMRQGSEISTTAGTALVGGDGGDITIDAEFIVAVPNEDSDISANAFTGRGGNINITTQGIYGTQFRPKDTPLSDITASSEFGINGFVTINTPDVDPSQGLSNLPTEVVDASNQIAQNCPSGGKVAQNQFVITGRGGLPDNPNQMLNSDAIWTDLRPAVQTAETHTISQESTLPTNSTVKMLVEAQEWVINDKGQVVLTRSTPIATPDSSWLSPVACPRS